MVSNPTYIVLFHHFRRVLEAAHGADIDVAPLKGAHLLTSVYPEDEGQRIISDIDFLVRPAHWEQTLELLSSFGMKTRQRKHDELLTHEVGFRLRSSGSERGILFEAHRYLLNPRRFPLDHDTLWERSSASTFEGVPCRRLATEDHAVHIALHTAIHRLKFLERSVTDIRMLLQRGDPDLDALVARAREWRATRAMWLHLKLLEPSLPQTRRLVERLQPTVVPRFVLNLLVPDSSGSRLSRLNHRAQAALLWPWLMDNPLQVVRYVLQHPRALGGKI